MSPSRVPDEALERALARAGDGAFAVGPDGRVAVWNRAAERILGWSATEVLGRPCCEVLAGGDGHGNSLCYQGCDVMGQVRLGEPVEHFEMKSRTKGGRAIWLDISILEAPATNGTRPVAVHLFRDITATKKLLEIVQERTVRAAQPNDNGASGLTKREFEILRLMAAGANTKVLAERLHVSPATVRNHAQNIFAKLDVHSRLEAVAWANQHRLV
ncbi:MAG: LuxR C-terminal-related transcriptional regulator [Candidatus Rokubacteria bacterium]|nr:LuxR C-terminal-related transcriptional regulator [Candidatus Rokubacteria bacterium]